MSSFNCFLISDFTVAYIFSGALCAPPRGSLIIPSIRPSLSILSEVSCKASAACSLKSQERHRMDEHDSGEITEYQVYLSIKTLSPTPIPSAPPDAPSPMMIQMT